MILMVSPLFLVVGKWEQEKRFAVYLAEILRILVFYLSKKFKIKQDFIDR